MKSSKLAEIIKQNVTAALGEDLGISYQTLISETAESHLSPDFTTQLIPEDHIARAHIFVRQQAILCGCLWFEESFRLLDPDCTITWSAAEGKLIKTGQEICEVRGNARAMLTAERIALNFLQTLSGTATLTRKFVDAVAGINVKIMDTRKTLPGLRMAQKYAVTVGGGHNQRTGLFDGVLIKENHIATAGGITAVMAHAQSIVPASIPIQIEVENLTQLDEALSAGANLILLDNFSLMNLRTAVSRNAKRAELEASGNITLEKVCLVAETGVDRISIGALTKDVNAIDLSMRFE